MIRGSCLCGGIRIEAERVSLLRHCHCSNCRKETGSAFGTVAVVRPSYLRFERGGELVQHYEYPPDGTRAFCWVCGSKALLAFARCDRSDMLTMILVWSSLRSLIVEGAQVDRGHRARFACGGTRYEPKWATKALTRKRFARKRPFERARKTRSAGSVVRSARSCFRDSRWFGIPGSAIPRSARCSRCAPVSRW